ncbi:MAG TPA: arginine--tRNA ligase [Desertimonas sp.]|nr:arginine--tRNA ligase [Desertimonas sp.]
MADLFAVLTERLAPAFDGVAGAHGVDPVVRPSDHADAQANGALALAKRLGRNPRDVAADVVAAADLDGVATAEIAGPGFINLMVDTSLLNTMLVGVSGDDRLGVPADPPRRYLVDYSAPNVAKELHIGHLRSTVIGDAVVRMLGFLGHDVVRENHVGDWGRPFGILIEQLVEVGAENDDDLNLDRTGELYKQATARFADDPDFAERARARVVSLQRREPDTIAVWRRLVELSEAQWQEDYSKLGVLLTVDDVVGESFYEDLMPTVVERLAAAGLLTESDGALVVFPPGFTNRDGDPLPLIVRSSAGASTYATSDLACVIDRIERVKAEILIYVVGAPQARYFEMLFAVSAMAGWLQPPAEAVHVPFGHVLGTDGKMLRSRSGDPVALHDVVDEAIERGVAAVVAKNPELPAPLRQTIGHAVGVGALKYADLSTDRVRDYVFDWDRMLSFDGNTAPYLQYAHTRICSLFRRAEFQRDDARGASVIVDEPEERALALRLLGYEAALREAAARYSPHRLCTYLYELAADFTVFYEHCPVLRAPSEELRASRLALSGLTARTLAHGLGLLGIDAPEQM